MTPISLAYWLHPSMYTHDTITCVDSILNGVFFSIREKNKIYFLSGIKKIIPESFLAKTPAVGWEKQCLIQQGFSVNTIYV